MKFTPPEDKKFYTLTGGVSDYYFIYLIFTDKNKYIVCKYSMNNYAKVMESKPLPAGIGGNLILQNELLLIPSGERSPYLHSVRTTDLTASFNTYLPCEKKIIGISDSYVLSPEYLSLYTSNFDLKERYRMPQLDRGEWFTSGFTVYNNNALLIMEDRKSYYIPTLEIPSMRIMECNDWTDFGIPRAFLTIFKELYILTQPDIYTGDVYAKRYIACFSQKKACV